MRTRDRQASADRRTLAFQLSGTAVAAVLWGMTVGALAVSSGRRTAALTGAGLFLILAVTVMSVVWYRERRRARVAGLATSRYLRLAQRLRRGGVIPSDPAERQAAAEILARRGRALEQWGSGNRRIAYGTGVVQLLAAAMQIWDHTYGAGVLLLFAAACSFSSPSVSRRQQRRNEATYRALRRRGGPEGESGADGARPAGPAPGDDPGRSACRPATRTAYTSPEPGAHPTEEN
ncbi:hypothetical protein [Streptomyces reniochalinae]|uniref:Uncharacterized protein n=1 Tax=Streptomyces reniochalinae TaxID=2250578 RepID=A0A367E995_9ACTN|nr:hypothetical protein [Streptomyces reniochalinae]RCG14626.1 hypothetical protein DQ392_26235 [Streptomyces reniochalinae]